MQLAKVDATGSLHVVWWVKWVFVQPEEYFGIEDWVAL